MDVITARTAMYHQVGPHADVPVELFYSTSDPWAVRCYFPKEPVPVFWAFGRDLLAEGLVGPAGDGDVHISPVDGRYTLLALCGPVGDGMAVLRAPTRDLAAFLARTHRVVPPGAEGALVDWDACVGRLLA
ncbi:SsgA family sporulation/cell division regulator [Kitasatospora sp. NPDC096147]|uniref:SsgA family sporulation/cell division regulator n=1 Tax=Kitasatospora sp. NPDC096147 TaxID=3364093 RepID=UPI003810BEC1